MATTTQSAAAPAATTRRKPFYKDMSVQVFAGMIAASAIGLFVIPMLYVTFQTIRERSSARFRRQSPRPGAAD